MPRALVTGGGIRVGREIAMELARSGFDIIVHCRSSQKGARQTAEEIQNLGRKAEVVVADLSDLPQTRRLADGIGELDCLILNAARYEHRLLEETSEGDFEEMFAVNVRAPFFLVKWLLPSLRRSRLASIVAITDVTIDHPYSALHRLAHYSASKAALAQLVRSWAVELAPQIRVNAVAPGPVAVSDATSGAERDAMIQRVPLRREGSPHDVAAAVAFLAASPYVTGSTITVDGGLSAS